MLMDFSFFTGELRIEGLPDYPGVPSVTQEAIKGDLKSFMAKREYDFYVNTIGVGNAKAFISYTGKKDRNPVGKWDNLESVLVDTIGGIKYSPIAYYVFFYYLRKNQASTTPLGVVGDDEAKAFSCMDKMINSWNQMAYMNEYLSRWLYDRKDEYGGYFFKDCMLEEINAMGI